jgi:hypothetical protein
LFGDFFGGVEKLAGFPWEDWARDRGFYDESFDAYDDLTQHWMAEIRHRRGDARSMTNHRRGGWAGSCGLFGSTQMLPGRPIGRTYRPGGEAGPRRGGGK